MCEWQLFILCMGLDLQQLATIAVNKVFFEAQWIKSYKVGNFITTTYNIFCMHASTYVHMCVCVAHGLTMKLRL